MKITRIARTLLFSLACICAICRGGNAAAALNLSKNIVHYAQEMEFYYQKPRPEMIPGLLEALDQGGHLAKGENRFMLAAFLAELAVKNKIDLRKLRKETNSGDITRTLAWSAHLAGKDEDFFQQRLRQQGDNLLASQIRQSPAPLSNWNLLSEKAVLQMFWAAFMASGNPVWLDRIIDASIIYVRQEERGIRSGAAFKVGAAAAASLYEMAPRHAAVVERLRHHSGEGPEKAMIDVMLRHAGEK